MASNPPTAAQSAAPTPTTPQQLNTAAGTAAGGVRSLFKKQNLKWIGYGAITIFLVVMIIAYTQEGVRFAGLILTGLIALYVGNRLRKKPDTSIGAIVVYAASALIAGTVIASDLGQAILHKTNESEQELAKQISLDCPSEETLDLSNEARGKRPELQLKQGCTTRLYIAPAVRWNVQFHVDHPALPLSVDDYVTYKWHGRTLEITPKSGFPVKEPVTIAIVDEAEAAAINATVAKAAVGGI